MTVNLLKGNSTAGPWVPHSDAVTSGGGTYQFSALPVGYYRVNFGGKNGYRKTSDGQGQDEAKDSEAYSGASFHLSEGETRSDIDGGYIEDAGREKAHFNVEENSPVGTVVGSVGDSSRFDDYSLTSLWFDISEEGVITVTDPSVLNAESYNPRVTLTVVAFGKDGSAGNVVIDVCIDITNVNEGPEYSQSQNLQGSPFHWVPLSFTDPEGDDVVSVTGNPQNGELLVVSEQFSSNPQAYWVPNASANGDQFELSASDGSASGETTEITISLNGSHDLFGRFKLGAVAPPMDAEDEPGASGDISEVADPDAAWDTQAHEFGMVDGYIQDFEEQIWNFYSNITNLSDWIGSQTPEAVEAMLFFLSNPPPDTTKTLAVQDILDKSNKVRLTWDQALSGLISAIDQLEFVGTVNLVDKEARLGNTGDSPYSLAIGDFTYWASANVTGAIVDGEIQYTATFVYNMWDPYDWNDAKGWHPSNLARLHRTGMARQYMTEGSHDVTFAWIKGAPPAPPAP